MECASECGGIYACVWIYMQSNSCANPLELMRKNRDFKPVFPDFHGLQCMLSMVSTQLTSDWLFCSPSRIGVYFIYIFYVYINEIWPYCQSSHTCLDQGWPFDPKRANLILSQGRLHLFLIHYAFSIYALCQVTLQFLPLEVEYIYFLSLVTCPQNAIGCNLNMGFKWACEVGPVLLSS